MNAGGKVTVAGLFSGKGGVGRSTLAVGLSVALCRKGERVLLADLNASLHCLDYLLGMEDRVLFGLSDLYKGASPEKVFPESERTKGLFLCLPPEEEGFCTDPEGYWAALEQGAAAVEASFLLLDLPATMTGISAFLLEKTDIPLSVTTGEKAALFGAEAFEAQARAAGKQARLLVNRLDMTDLSSYRNGRESVKQWIDRTHTLLVGVVPESYELFRCSEEGRIEEAGETALCFLNIATRLKGEEVPLFSGMREEKKLRRSLLGF